ncbi:TonB-dependent vitamin B12 receptor [Thiothrix fructosivorans]|uniref:TonB-dependent vitamin B12 receptor n=1 Tax=Thiothrix fructosivorans TaxID=111770 RepID=A0A8B0SMC6_9GAMM|nr:TonB-dependent vitamin B12 receptor [Thiothrix fructosivorans]QTX12104.1 TonB-dependent vitamin B12 receptor [Thiothrix fructosivorans]
MAEDATTLDDIVVTADRKARSVDTTLAPVSIITRQDIEQYQATSLPDVLRRLPGITLSNSGGAGKTTSVFMRGTNSSHVLVLVDGVKVGSATTGSIAFEDLPLDQVERIEVVRGPRSSLYGSEAIGGVIQIFTRKGGNGFQPEVSVSVGSHNTQKANVNLAGGTEATWYNLNAGTEQTDGFNATANNQEPDADGYARDSVALRAGHRFANGTEAEISAVHAAGDSQFDSSFNNETHFTQSVVSGKVTHALSDKVLLKAQLGQARDESDNYLNGQPLTAFRTYNTRRNSAAVQADVGVGENGSATVGLDWQNDQVTSDSVYDRTSRDNTGVFANYQTDFGKNRVDIAARHDDNEQFGGHNTGAVAIGRDLANGMRVTGSYGTAFKAPNFNDLYYPFSGDPTLTPETAQNAELGISGKLAGGKAQWSANVFSNEINNLISYPPPDYQVSQTDKARIQGLELSATTQLAGWEVNGNATLQQPENRSGVDAGKQLIYRPEQHANVDIDRELGKFRVGATVRGESQRYTDSANTESKKLAGYGTLDVRADYRVSKDWTVGAKLGNVLGKDYQTNNGYNQDGVNGLVTVKYAPK